MRRQTHADASQILPTAARAHIGRLDWPRLYRCAHAVPSEHPSPSLGWGGGVLARSLAAAFADEFADDAVQGADFLVGGLGAGEQSADVLHHARPLLRHLEEAGLVELGLEPLHELLHLGLRGDRRV